MDVGTLLKGIEESILIEDEVSFSRLLQRIPFKDLSMTPFLSLFERLITIAYKFNSVKMARLICDEWISAHIDPYLEFESYLFLSSIPIELLKWIYKHVLTETNMNVHLTNLLNYDPSDDTIHGAQRVIEVYGTLFLTWDNVNNLYIQAKEKNAKAYDEFFSRLRREVAPVAEKPDWVKNYQKLDPLPTQADILKMAWTYKEKHSSNVSTPQNDDDAVELMTAGLRRMGIHMDEMEDMTEQLRSFYNALTTKEKQMMLNPIEQVPVIYDLSTKDKLIQWLGPTNMIYGTNLLEDHECCYFGGDRMLLCRCFERFQGYEEDQQEVADLSDDLDWFSGFCESCDRKILKSWYALRIPLMSGGWKGCYCSWPCVNSATLHKGERALLTIIKDTIQKHGIQDRV